MITTPQSNELNYSAYNGTMLPPFSGCSIENACFSYFSDGGVFRTQHMIDKVNAIHRYINQNLKTEDDVYKFFVNYIQKYK